MNELIMADPNRVDIQEVQVGLEQIIGDPDDYETWSGAIKKKWIGMGDTQRTICIRIMMEMVITKKREEGLIDPFLFQLMSCSDPSVSMPHAGSVLSKLMVVMAKDVCYPFSSSFTCSCCRFHPQFRMQFFLLFIVFILLVLHMK